MDGLMKASLGSFSGMGASSTDRFPCDPWRILSTVNSLRVAAVSRHRPIRGRYTRGRGQSPEDPRMKPIPAAVLRVIEGGGAMRRIHVAATVAALLASFAAGAAAQDVAGSADHPMIARFKGSTIRAQSRQEFESYTLPLGPADKSETRFQKQASVEGKVTK